jgi:uncharacterized Rmd1/YagE family protein
MVEQCKAFCSAASYQMKPLYKFFKEINPTTEIFGGAIYVPISKGSVFFFSYGCVVFWNLSDNEIAQMFKKIKSFENESLEALNEEVYNITEGSVIKVHLNEICFGKENGKMEELSVSHALAQSMKLLTFEERVTQTIKRTEHIPKSLAKTGDITLSGKDIAKEMGKLFLDRSSINLIGDIHETPDFFWENPKLEPIYHMAAYDQDIKPRVEVINERLKLIGELFQILSDVCNSRHSSALEIIIIVFIAIEIILTILFHVIG